MASGSGHMDYRNNVVYNWGYQSLYGGEAFQKGKPERNFSIFNVVADYYKPGPATKPGEVSYRVANPGFRNETDDYGKWYISNNVIEGNAEVSGNNWGKGVQTKIPHEKIKLEKPWQAMPINQHSPEEAYKLVLKHVGASLPKRDPIDARIIKEATEGTATYEGESYKKRVQVADPTKKTGILDSQDDVGGWPILNSTPAPVDNDHDGMPDIWEKKNGLNPDYADDRNKVASDGYTML